MFSSPNHEAEFEAVIQRLETEEPHLRAAVGYGICLAQSGYATLYPEDQDFIAQPLAVQIEYLTSWQTVQDSLMEKADDREAALGIELFKSYLGALIGGDPAMAGRMVEKLEPIQQEGLPLFVPDGC